MSNLKISAVQKEIPYMIKNDLSPDKVIFVKWFRHYRTGKRIYPRKGSVIAIRIRKKKKSKVV